MNWILIVRRYASPRARQVLKARYNERGDISEGADAEDLV